MVPRVKGWTYLFIIVLVAAASAQQLGPPRLPRLVCSLVAIGVRRDAHLAAPTFAQAPAHGLDPIVALGDAELAEL